MNDKRNEDRLWMKWRKTIYKDMKKKSRSLTLLQMGQKSLDWVASIPSGMCSPCMSGEHLDNMCELHELPSVTSLLICISLLLSIFCLLFSYDTSRLCHKKFISFCFFVNLHPVLQLHTVTCFLLLAYIYIYILFFYQFKIVFSTMFTNLYCSHNYIHSGKTFQYVLSSYV